MAIDLTDKALDLADRGANLADDFLDAVEGLEKLLEIATDSGISMTDYNTELAASALKHIDGATFNRLGGASGAINSIVAAIDAPDSAGTGVTVRELFNRLRKNY